MFFRFSQEPQKVWRGLGRWRLKMDIKTGELIGEQLDWFVGEALGVKREPGHMFIFPDEIPCGWIMGQFQPSRNWDYCGKIIEQYEIQISPMNGRNKPKWMAMIQDVDAFGPTPIIAACRAFVEYKLGETVTVTVPNELEG